MASPEKKLGRRGFIQTAGRTAAGGLLAAGGFMSAREFLRKREKNFRRQWTVAAGMNKDPGVLDQYARDFGNVCYQVPSAVVYPESVRDIQELIWYCNEHKIPMNMRGVGHACNGQSLISGGIILDLKPVFNKIRMAGDDALLEPGITWVETQKFLNDHGRGAMVTPDYMGITVGGNLSIGGVGTRSIHFGHESDQVQELEVVTGKGDVVRCSRKENPDLFRFTLHGLGQLTIMTKIRTATMAYRPRSVLASIYYSNFDEYIKTLHHVIADYQPLPYDFIYGFWLQGSFLCVIRVGKDDLGDAKAMTEFRTWVASLGGKPIIEEVQDFEFYDHNTFAPNVQRRWSWYHIYADEAPPLPLFQEMSREVHGLLTTEYQEIQPYINLYSIAFRADSAVGFPLATLPRGPDKYAVSVGMEFDLPPGNLKLLERTKDFVAGITDRYLPLGLAIYMYSWYRLTADQKKMIWGPALTDFAAVKKATDPNHVINPAGVINSLIR